MKKRLIKFVALQLLILLPVLYVHAQEISIGGKVSAIDNNPIAGVTVVVDGTSVGTITDSDGYFSLRIPADSKKLIFSFIGMKTKAVPVTASTNYNILLEEDTYSLEEVVAIGYGTIKKSDLTGSVASVRSDAISAFPTTTVAQSLQGRAAGVLVQQNTGEPGATMQVRIRGTNSIMGRNDPLWIIDGFPADPKILNDEDVENIEILKDASATAIYGSRGANGVIIVTTKKGKAGGSRVDYEGSYSLQTLRKKMDLMNAKEYMQFYNIQQLNDNGKKYFSDSEINNAGEGTDWQDLIFRNAPIRKHSLTISGGSDRTVFSFGTGYFDQNGIVKNSGYRRISLRANIDHKISEKIKVSFNTILTRLDNNSKSGGTGDRGSSLFGGTISAPPTVTPYNDDGTYRLLSTVYPFSANSIKNPVPYINEVSEKNYSNNVMANLAFIFEPVDGLSVKVSGNISNSDSRSDNYTSLKYPNSQGSASVSTSQDLHLNSDNIVTYNKIFNKDHSLNVMGAFTYESSKSTDVGVSGTGFLSDVTETYNIGAASTVNTPTSGYSEWTLLSYLGRINYSYKNKYLVTASFRADGSSRYSEGSKWGYFPSGSVAWRVTEEEFMKDISLISDLKIRGGYGETGSTAINPYYTLEMLSSGKTTFANDLYTYFAPGTRLPANLKWETTAQTDIGMDLGILENRLRVTADYYIKKTRNLLNNVQLPASLGYTTTVQNIGEISNKGFELQLDANILNRKFKWDIGSNISFNKNKVVKLYGGQDIVGINAPMAMLNVSYNIIREGQPLGMFYGYLEDGYDENGAITYKDIDGVDGITTDDKTFIGDPNPDFTYGFTSNMQWKNFELNLFIQGSQGNDIMSFNVIQQTMDYGYGLNTFKEVLYDHWTPETPNAKYPKITKSNLPLMSDRFVFDGSYLRLKDIQLVYNLPVRKMGWQWLSKGQVYVSGQNLLTITSYPWWDPEVNRFGGSNSIDQGTDWNAYPTAKGFTIGVKLSF